MIRIVLFALAVSACGAHSEVSTDAAASFGGDPVVVDQRSNGEIRVLENPGFRVGYSEKNRQPAWVGFRAASVKGQPRLGKRPRNFSKDERLSLPVTSWDYTARRGQPSYDRGHLAPNYLIGKLYGREAQLATFLMSNVSPQRKRFNGLLWQRLEEAEVDVVAPAMEELFVLTGPVFGEKPETIKGRIPVPEAFYRIWLDFLPNGEPRMLAFIVPQTVCGDEPLTTYLVSVDEVESRTGLDFYSGLDDLLEQRLEERLDKTGWPVGKFDRKPARYADKFDKDAC